MDSFPIREFSRTLTKLLPKNMAQVGLKVQRRWPRLKFSKGMNASGQKKSTFYLKDQQDDPHDGFGVNDPGIS